MQTGKFMTTNLSNLNLILSSEARGHFEVRKSSSPVTGQVADCFTVKIKQMKRSDMVASFRFCSHYYRSKTIGRAEPGRSILQPVQLTWRALEQSNVYSLNDTLLYPTVAARLVAGLSPLRVPWNGTPFQAVAPERI